MNHISRIRISLAATFAALTLVGPAGAAQRAFVASTGNDANTANFCTFAFPCRTFTAAMTQVDSGGEIVALDAAGYGAVTITKSVTITSNPGFYAGIAVSTGNAVTIGTAGVNVVLRGLLINGVGGLNGVSMTDGARLSIENCVISNFSSAGGSGIYVGGAATVRIVDSLIRDNDRGVIIQGNVVAAIAGSKLLGSGTAGLFVHGEAANSRPIVSITDSVLTHNNAAVHAYETNATALVRIWVIRSTIAHNTGYGVRSQFDGGPTVISVSESMVVANTVQLAQEGGGATLESFGNNTVQQGSNVGTI